MTRRERLNAPGPKRILSLDGGGIRGLITLGFLERIEQLLRERHGQPDLKLCNYFDVIGGTSTGAIIAAGLATGMNVADIKHFYLELGRKIFARRTWKQWQAYFDAKPLATALEQTFGSLTFGDATITTGLSIPMKRADTGATLLFDNHPDSRSYSDIKDVPLWQVIRASTAAPTYFVAEKVAFANGEVAALMDGAVSMANNPAFYLFMLTTLKHAAYHWPLGEDQLLLVSVGTGCWRRQVKTGNALNHNLWTWAKEIPAMLIDDASWHNQLILQGLSRTPTPWNIGGEASDLAYGLFGTEPCLSYLRYNVWLEPGQLQDLGLEHLNNHLALLREPSAAEHRFDLALIGEQAARESVFDHHFPISFDLPGQPYPSMSGPHANFTNNFENGATTP